MKNTDLSDFDYLKFDYLTKETRRELFKALRKQIEKKQEQQLKSGIIERKHVDTELHMKLDVSLQTIQSYKNDNSSPQKETLQHVILNLAPKKTMEIIAPETNKVFEDLIGVLALVKEDREIIKNTHTENKYKFDEKLSTLEENLNGLKLALQDLRRKMDNVSDNDEQFKNVDLWEATRYFKIFAKKVMTAIARDEWEFFPEKGSVNEEESILLSLVNYKKYLMENDEEFKEIAEDEEKPGKKFILPIVWTKNLLWGPYSGELLNGENIRFHFPAVTKLQRDKSFDQHFQDVLEEILDFASETIEDIEDLDSIEIDVSDLGGDS